MMIPIHILLYQFIKENQHQYIIPKQINSSSEEANNVRRELNLVCACVILGCVYFKFEVQLCCLKYISFVLYFDEQRFYAVNILQRFRFQEETDQRVTTLFPALNLEALRVAADQPAIILK
ncbi:Hypothetical_protein [Hexamita inflata]|uniref:Hypothetical_protein n=1 Tax=Hexamita inflata TaxID=28002 RepID=A0AA86UJK0_9EUKA|nr:Hypothetical protein HINF_LOCUS45869 [Hexamita inflata]